MSSGPLELTIPYETMVISCVRGVLVSCWRGFEPHLAIRWV